MSNPDPAKSKGKGRRLPPAIVAFPDASQQAESSAPAPEAAALGRYEVDIAACRPSPAARPVRSEHVAALARSIAEIGLLQPIVVRAVEGGFEVMAGLHRLRAFEQLGRAQILAIVRHDDDLRAELALIDENLIRNELTPAERAAQIARRKAIYEALHPETRHGASGKHRPKSQSRKVCDSEIEPPEPTARFTKATAEAIGQSERTIQLEAARGNELGSDALAKVVRTSLDKGEELDALAVLAKEAPDQCYALITRAAEGEKVSAKAEVKKIARQKREAELGAKQAALPQQKFGVILADPEWKWRAWSDAGMDRGVENTYPTSETTDIAARDVLSIAADDCVLVLWARADMLPDALQVMAAWGFRYVAQRVWRKARMSTGYWFRYDHELVLIGSRGKPVAPAMGTQERSVFEGEPAVPGLNSSKPDCLAEWIERNWPNTPKIELNRRGPPRSGWASWGNEADASGGVDAAQPAGDDDEDPVSSLPGLRPTVGRPRELACPQSMRPADEDGLPGHGAVRRLGNDESDAATSDEDDGLTLPACVRRGADNRPPWEAKAAQPETDAQTAPLLPDASAAAAESSDRDSAAVPLSEALPGEPAGSVPAEAAE